MVLSRSVTGVGCGAKPFFNARGLHTLPLQPAKIPAKTASRKRANTTFALFGGLGGGDLALLTTVNNIPHPDKVAKGGEDAWFISTPDSGGGGSLAVADGVGGYNKMGIDPGLYSRQLMRLALKEDQVQGAAVDPAGVLSWAQQGCNLPGAATVCVLQLAPKGRKLLAANLGDSGFLILRGGAIVLASEALQHYFDCPYQMSDLSRGRSETAEDAQMFEIEVKEGDVIVTASDGLFDNVFQDEIVKIVNSHVKSGGSRLAGLKTAAAELGEVAFRNSSDEQYESPFAVECFAEDKQLAAAQAKKLASLPGPFGRMAGSLAGSALGTLTCQLGGKPDDITVLVTEVVKASSSQAELKTAQEEAQEGLDKVTLILDKSLSEFQIKEAAKTIKPKKNPAKADGTYTTEQIDGMDKATLQNLLQQYGLPTSGKISTLKERLASAAGGK
mmetsp:Transcript_25564/g.35273  ORF Transcript_25564/g.35273 Transcript_25564/m.35273 type:complete len:444 (-) Transcript_25564:63-1394(-)|eukprot:CAMPEP_0196582002 /NCGR_PEP_ID=MMETSP1081-20130531/36932_1 /TAXON_ID=36882 /ORGANISM="Pyramimonas amylifera, Strain CCMP720" /LENGTH=443 /DNA_ID=CAMNT_0041902453 /DNA_START=75 /DNA_END=1406 /DNA_ORIENTATION=-